MIIAALDTETTGLDLHHGAKPFFISVCITESGNLEDAYNIWWEFDVDPKTRQPIVDQSSLDEVVELVRSVDLLVLQNSKFDYKALGTIYPNIKDWWPWSKVRDTLISGHMLASNQPHDLTSMSLIYLGVNTAPFEEALKSCAHEALTLVKRGLKRMAKEESYTSPFEGWRIAQAGDPMMPSAKEKTWKYDLWVMRQVAEIFEYPSNHPWHTVTREYANSDTASTLGLYFAHNDLIKERNLDAIYKERLKVLPVAVAMEIHGVTVNNERLEELMSIYTQESAIAGRVCVNIAKKFGVDLELPKGSSNNSLRSFVFDTLKLKANKKSAKTGEPSLDKSVIEHWQATLPERGLPLTFINSLGSKRKRDTAMSYMESYKRFWIAAEGFDSGTWYKLHPWLNPTGTDTLRWSSENPNEQNISKKEGFNLRYAFGPAPGREWWSMDAQNIELRLPAYESGESEMIALFENPDDPPYFGSNHLLTAHILHPKLFEACINGEGILDGRLFKKKYASTYYQWVKNGNFAVQYGAVESSGTADRAYHVPGGQHKIQSRFTKIKALNDRMIAFANQYGYVETMPDKSVDPERGYPLLCTRTKHGRGVAPTIPLNYHVQGTACWWMMKAMIRVSEFLADYNSLRQPERRIHIVMQVHDELVFDFPRSKVDPRSNPTGSQLLRTNLPLIKKIKALMELGGDDIGVPTPVSCEYHPNNWSEGFSISV